MIEKVKRNIQTTTKLESGVSNADLIIEAIVENIDAKQKLFSQVEAAAQK